MVLGSHCSEETKAKISASEKGKVTWNKGIPRTDAEKAKIAAGQVGHVMPESVRLALLKANLDRHDSAETSARRSAGQMGHSVSPEARAKLSVARWKGGRAVSARKDHAKRKNLGFVPINQPFAGCEGHHLDHDYAVYIPKVLHHSVPHNVWTGRNMEQINSLALQWLAQNP